MPLPRVYGVYPCQPAGSYLRCYYFHEAASNFLPRRSNLSSFEPVSTFSWDFCYSVYFILPFFFFSLFFHLSNFDYPPVMCPSSTSSAENPVVSNTQALPELIAHWLDVNRAPTHTNAELQTRLSARGTVQGWGTCLPISSGQGRG